MNENAISQGEIRLEIRKRVNEKKNESFDENIFAGCEGKFELKLYSPTRQEATVHDL